MQGGDGRRPCKFGNNCNKFMEGKCTFLHQNPGRFTPQFPVQDDGPKRPCRFGANCQKFKQGACTFFHDYAQTQPTVMPESPYVKPNNFPHDNITQEFCKNFQTGDCTHNNCKRLHGFTKGDQLKRVLKFKEVPNTRIAKLCTLQSNGTKYLTLRLDNVVNILQYDAESAVVKELGQTFTLEYPDIHWYNTAEKYIYFAYENKSTSFTNIGFIDVSTNQRITVDNAHKLKVTGIVHIGDLGNQPIVLSSSMEGTIKAWKIEGDKMVLSSEITEGIQSCFKTNTNFEILYLNKEYVAGSQVLTAGTSDNRLLLWIGNELKYQVLVFEEPYNKVLSVKYIKAEGNWIAMAIIWSANMSMSALMAVNLSNNQHQVLAKEESNNSRYLYSTMESIGQLFILGNLMGMASIYKIPNFNNKIGCIMHNNGIADMVSFSSFTKTGIEVLNLLVLEKLEGERQGSFAVYSVR